MDIEKTIRRAYQYLKRAYQFMFYDAVAIGLIIISFIVYFNIRSNDGGGKEYVEGFIFLLLIAIIYISLYILYANLKYKNMMDDAKQSKLNQEEFENLHMAVLYGEGGVCHEWPAVTIKYNGEAYAKMVWENFARAGFLNGVSAPVILSPTAAKGYYEKIAFQYLNGIGYAPQFILTDVVHNEREQDIYEGQAKLVYVNEALNVNQLTERFEEGQQPFEARPHVIWDLKGGLWHALDHQNGKQALCSLLAKYHQILRPNGVILIDAYKQSELRTLINTISYHTFKKLIWGYAEKSTYQKIKKHLTDTAFSSQITDLFDVSESFGTKNYESIALVKKQNSD